MRNRTPDSSHRWYDELKSENTQALLDRLETEMDKEVIEDSELIAAISKILDERAPAPTPKETPEESLREFRAKFAPMLEDDLESKKERRPVRQTIARAAMAACLCIVLLGVVAQACGIDLVGQLLTWGEETFVLHGSNRSGQMVLADVPEGGFASTEDAVAACGITEPVVVKWIPKTYEIESIRIKKMAHADDITTRYVTDDNKKIVHKIFIYHGEGDNDTTGEHSDSAATPYVVNNTTFFLSSNNKQYRANWVVGNCVCSIAGDLTESEITQMIDSIFT